MNTPQNKSLETIKIIGDWDIQPQQCKEEFLQQTGLQLEVRKEDDLFTRVETRLNKMISIIKKGLPEK